MLQGLRTVVYYVGDVAAAREWYASALGQRPYYDTPYYVGFEVGGYELGLHPAGDGASPGVGGHVAYWGVPDVEAALNQLVQAGAKVAHKPQDVGGGIIIASVIDPFGNELGLIFNPHFQAKG